MWPAYNIATNLSLGKLAHLFRPRRHPPMYIVSRLEKYFQRMVCNTAYLRFSSYYSHFRGNRLKNALTKRVVEQNTRSNKFQFS